MSNDYLIECMSPLAEGNAFLTEPVKSDRFVRIWRLLSALCLLGGEEEPLREGGIVVVSKPKSDAARGVVIRRVGRFEAANDGSDDNDDENKSADQGKRHGSIAYVDVLIGDTIERIHNTQWISVAPPSIPYHRITQPTRILKLLMGFLASGAAADSAINKPPASPLVCRVRRMAVRVISLLLKRPVICKEVAATPRVVSWLTSRALSPLRPFADGMEPSLDNLRSRSLAIDRYVRDRRPSSLDTAPLSTTKRSTGTRKGSRGGASSASVYLDRPTVASLKVMGQAWGYQAANPTSLKRGEQLPADAEIIYIARFQTHIAILCADGRVFCMGVASYGCLGNGSTTGNTLPCLSKGAIVGKKIKCVAVGTYHTICCTDTEVFGWGMNSYGQLGLGSNTQQTSPVRIKKGLEGKSIRFVAAGYYISAVQLDDGKLLGCGYSHYGHLGTSTHNKMVLTEIKGAPSDGFVQAAIHNSMMAGVTDEGLLYTWGNNPYHGHGSAHTSKLCSPKQLQLDKNRECVVVEIKASQQTCYALTSEGVLYSWGYNYCGSLGHSNTQSIYTPKPIEGELKGKIVASFSVVYQHCAAVDVDGNLYTWGLGSKAMGRETVQHQYSPKAITVSMPRLASVSLSNHLLIAIPGNPPGPPTAVRKWVPMSGGGSEVCFPYAAYLASTIDRTKAFGLVRVAIGPTGALVLAATRASSATAGANASSLATFFVFNKPVPGTTKFQISERSASRGPPAQRVIPADDASSDRSSAGDAEGWQPSPGPLREFWAFSQSSEGTTVQVQCLKSPDGRYKVSTMSETGFTSVGSFFTYADGALGLPLFIPPAAGGPPARLDKPIAASDFNKSGSLTLSENGLSAPLPLERVVPAPEFGSAGLSVSVRLFGGEDATLPSIPALGYRLQMKAARTLLWTWTNSAEQAAGSDAKGDAKSQIQVDLPQSVRGDVRDRKTGFVCTVVLPRDAPPKVYVGGVLVLTADRNVPDAFSERVMAAPRGSESKVPARVIFASVGPEATDVAEAAVWPFALTQEMAGELSVQLAADLATATEAQARSGADFDFKYGQDLLGSRVHTVGKVTADTLRLNGLIVGDVKSSGEFSVDTQQLASGGDSGRSYTLVADLKLPAKAPPNAGIYPLIRVVDNDATFGSKDPPFNGYEAARLSKPIDRIPPALSARVRLPRGSTLASQGGVIFGSSASGLPERRALFSSDVKNQASVVLTNGGARAVAGKSFCDAGCDAVLRTGVHTWEFINYPNPNKRDAAPEMVAGVAPALGETEAKIRKGGNGSIADAKVRGAGVWTAPAGWKRVSNGRDSALQIKRDNPADLGVPVVLGMRLDCAAGTLRFYEGGLEGRELVRARCTNIKMPVRPAVTLVNGDVEIRGSFVIEPNSTAPPARCDWEFVDGETKAVDRPSDTTLARGKRLNLSLKKAVARDGGIIRIDSGGYLASQSTDGAISGSTFTFEALVRPAIAERGDQGAGNPLVSIGAGLTPNPEEAADDAATDDGPSVPACAKGHRMRLSSYNGGGYRGGWICDCCRKSGKGLRWLCVTCTSDFCQNCAKKLFPAPKKTTEGKGGPTGGGTEGKDANVGAANPVSVHQSSADARGKPPKCPKGHFFQWSATQEDSYDEGWWCDECEQEGGPSGLGDWRWNCFQCEMDFCQPCKDQKYPELRAVESSQPSSSSDANRAKRAHLKPGLVVMGDGAPVAWATVPAARASGAWTHVVISGEELPTGTCKFTVWRNGAMVGTIQSTAGKGAIAATSARVVCGFPRGGVPIELQSVRMYDRALGSDEVTGCYAETLLRLGLPDETGTTLPYQLSDQGFNFSVTAGGCPALLVKPRGCRQLTHVFEGVDLRTGLWEDLHLEFDEKKITFHLFRNGAEVGAWSPANRAVASVAPGRAWVGSDARDGHPGCFQGVIQAFATWKSTGPAARAPLTTSKPRDGMALYYDMYSPRDDGSIRDGSGGNNPASSVVVGSDGRDGLLRVRPDGRVEAFGRVSEMSLSRGRWVRLKLSTSADTGDFVVQCDATPILSIERGLSATQAQRMALGKRIVLFSNDHALGAPAYVRRLQVQQGFLPASDLNKRWKSVADGDEPYASADIKVRSRVGPALAAIGFKPHWVQRALSIHALDPYQSMVYIMQNTKALLAQDRYTDLLVSATALSGFGIDMKVCMAKMQAEGREGPALSRGEVAWKALRAVVRTGAAESTGSAPSQSGVSAATDMSDHDIQAFVRKAVKRASKASSRALRSATPSGGGPTGPLYNETNCSVPARLFGTPVAVPKAFAPVLQPGTQDFFQGTEWTWFASPRAPGKKVTLLQPKVKNGPNKVLISPPPSSMATANAFSSWKAVPKGLTLTAFNGKKITLQLTGERKRLVSTDAKRTDYMVLSRVAPTPMAATKAAKAFYKSVRALEATRRDTDAALETAYARQAMGALLANLPRDVPLPVPPDQVLALARVAEFAQMRGVIDDVAGVLRGRLLREWRSLEKREGKASDGSESTVPKPSQLHKCAPLTEAVVQEALYQLLLLNTSDARQGSDPVDEDRVLRGNEPNTGVLIWIFELFLDLVMAPGRAKFKPLLFGPALVNAILEAVVKVSGPPQLALLAVFSGLLQQRRSGSGDVGSAAPPPRPQYDRRRTRFLRELMLVLYEQQSASKTFTPLLRTLLGVNMALANAEDEDKRMGRLDGPTDTRSTEDKERGAWFDRVRSGVRVATAFSRGRFARLPETFAKRVWAAYRGHDMVTDLAKSAASAMKKGASKSSDAPGFAWSAQRKSNKIAVASGSTPLLSQTIKRSVAGCGHEIILATRGISKGTLRVSVHVKSPGCHGALGVVLGGFSALQNVPQSRLGSDKSPNTWAISFHSGSHNEGQRRLQVLDRDAMMNRTVDMEISADEGRVTFSIDGVRRGEFKDLPTGTELVPALTIGCSTNIEVKKSGAFVLVGDSNDDASRSASRVPLNVALGRAARQSSTAAAPPCENKATMAGYNVASNATDGYSKHHDATCATTSRDAKEVPWWEVDLGESFKPKRVQIAFGPALQAQPKPFSILCSDRPFSAKTAEGALKEASYVLTGSMASQKRSVTQGGVEWVGGRAGDELDCVSFALRGGKTCNVGGTGGNEKPKMVLTKGEWVSRVVHSTRGSYQGSGIMFVTNTGRSHTVAGNQFSKATSKTELKAKPGEEIIGVKIEKAKLVGIVTQKLNNKTVTDPSGTLRVISERVVQADGKTVSTPSSQLTSVSTTSSAKRMVPQGGVEWVGGRAGDELDRVSFALRGGGRSDVGGTGGNEKPKMTLGKGEWVSRVVHRTRGSYQGSGIVFVTNTGRSHTVAGNQFSKATSKTELKAKPGEEIIGVKIEKAKLVGIVTQKIKTQAVAEFGFVNADISRAPPTRYVRVQLSEPGQLVLDQVRVIADAPETKRVTAKTLPTSAFHQLTSLYSREASAVLVGLLNRYAATHSMPTSTAFISKLDKTVLATNPQLEKIKAGPAALEMQYWLLLQFNDTIDELIPLVDLEAPVGFSATADAIRLCRSLIPWAKKSMQWQGALSSSACAPLNPTIRLDMIASRKLFEERRTDHKGRVTMFGQLYQQTKSMDVSRMWKCAKNTRAFNVQFLGFHTADAGGPYRDALDKMVREVESPVLPLFVRCPNNKNKVGENRHAVVPRPSSKAAHHKALYRFLGRLMGMAIRTRNLLPLNLTSVVWKPLVRDVVTVGDIEAVDKLAFNVLSMVRAIEKLKPSADLFDAKTNDVNWTVAGSDGKLVELVPGGADRKLTWANRAEYKRALVKFRVREFDTQVDAIRRGLADVVPLQFTSLFTWREMMTQVSGRGMTRQDCDMLEKMTSYGGGHNRQTPTIKNFWKMMRDVFSDEQRSQFIRFVWGRSRLPTTQADFSQRFSISGHSQAGDDPDKWFPIAHTCGFSIELPKYTTLEVMTKRIVWAMENCASTDADGGMNNGGGAGLDELSDDEGVSLFD